jgi:hypothetical protein
MLSILHFVKFHLIVISEVWICVHAGFSRGPVFKLMIYTFFGDSDLYETYG